jgi:hypothetical protein
VHVCVWSIRGCVCQAKARRRPAAKFANTLPLLVVGVVVVVVDNEALLCPVRGGGGGGTNTNNKHV